MQTSSMGKILRNWLRCKVVQIKFACEYAALLSHKGQMLRGKEASWQDRRS